ncbi:MAG: phosphoethanolamine transferase [Ramlibacter sp.]
MTKKSAPALWLTLPASLWMATVANLPLWRELDALHLLDTPADWALAGGLAATMAGLLTGILSLFAWRRWTLKPVIGVLLAMSASAAYFMWTYHVVVDADMVVNVLQTDPQEVRALLNVRMIGALLGLFALPLAVVSWFPLRETTVVRQAGRNVLAVLVSAAAVAAVVVATYQPLASTMRNHKQLRYLMNPLSSVWALGYVAAKPWIRDNSLLEAVGTDAVAPPATASPPLLVLVVGETARAANFGLNGYSRPTTPLLEREQVISFADASACGTSTAASLPCMFSPLGRTAFDKRPHNYENLLDVLQRAGLAVLWLDNQSGCKGLCDRVPHASTRPADAGLCAQGECLDELLLKDLEARLAALPPERRARGTVIVMHQMGSHGPAYYKRSPPAAKRFLPECTSNNLQECSREQVTNAYDNSIVYTDLFLASVIRWLKEREPSFSPAMLYVSDHGESLGENNLYLHGLPYAIAPDVQKKVPWVTWISPAFAGRTGLSLQCLRTRREVAVSHDNYFHSVLGLMGVRTSVYAPDKDAYLPCATPADGAPGSLLPLNEARVHRPRGLAVTDADRLLAGRSDAVHGGPAGAARYSRA